MSRRTAFLCADPACRTHGNRTALGHLHGPRLELRAGVTALPIPGGATVRCPVCGACRPFRGKVIMVVSEMVQAC